MGGVCSCTCSSRIAPSRESIEAEQRQEAYDQIRLKIASVAALVSPGSRGNTAANHRILRRARQALRVATNAPQTFTISQLQRLVRSLEELDGRLNYNASMHEAGLRGFIPDPESEHSHSVDTASVVHLGDREEQKDHSSARIGEASPIANPGTDRKIPQE
jgi:hypothetical protein